MKLLIQAIIVLLLQGCTYASMHLQDGTSVSYFDFHPGGNAVDAEGVWNNVASFTLSRETGDSTQVAGAVAEGVARAIVP